MALTKETTQNLSFFLQRSPKCLSLWTEFSKTPLSRHVSPPAPYQKHIGCRWSNSPWAEWPFTWRSHSWVKLMSFAPCICLTPANGSQILRDERERKKNVFREEIAITAAIRRFKKIKQERKTCGKCLPLSLREGGKSRKWQSSRGSNTVLNNIYQDPRAPFMNFSQPNFHANIYLKKWAVWMSRGGLRKKEKPVV